MPVPFSFEIELTLDDYQAYLKWIQKRALKKARRPFLPFRSWLFWLAVLIMLLLMLFSPLRSLDLWWFLVLGLTFAGLTIVLIFEQTRATQKQMMPGENGATLGKRLYTFDDTGMGISTDSITSTVAWAAVWSVEEADDYFFLMLDTIVAQIVPKRVFHSPGAIDDFRSYVQERISS